MKYGKIRIEDGNLIFTKHMMINNLPCKDILWAYQRREGVEGGAGGKQLTLTYLVVITRRKKRYKFDMSEKEVQDCIRLLRALNPNMAVGFPKGGRLALESLPNTRDLGAICTEDGRHIIPRKLLRSGELYHVSMADKAVLLDDYRLKTVIDFRTEKERSQKPDTMLKGVENYHLSVLDEDATGISRDNSLMDMMLHFDGDANQYMLLQYQNLAADSYCQKQYANFLDILLRHQDGAALWHCSAGKDRAGVGTALLLCALGVSEEVIREDYMRTNHYLEADLQYILRYIESKGQMSERVEKNMSIFFKVRDTYIEKVFQTMKREYGSVEHYMRRALYLTPKAQEELQKKYLL